MPESISEIAWRYEGYSDIRVYVRAEVKGDPAAIAASIRMASETNHSVVELKRALADWAATNRLSLRFIEGPSHDDPLAEHLGISVFPGGEVAR